MDRKNGMTNKQLKTIAGGLLLALTVSGIARATDVALATAAVERSNAAGTASFAATVEAIRQSALAAQVAGSVVDIRVKPGDIVRAGQVLVRLDARAAEQTAASTDAQAQAARASLEVASQDYERKQQLLKKNYISQAAFERAQAQWKATQAQLAAQLAQAGAAHSESGFYVVTAPYAGVIAEVPVVMGDMALPGKPLVSIYDPAALRVTTFVPQTAISDLQSGKDVKVQIPGLPGDRQWLIPSHVQVLPTVDPATHTLEVRLELPRLVKGVSPGMFARAWLPTRPLAADGTAGAGADAAASRLFVPAQAVVHRAEVTALYIVGDSGRPTLRQVRLGERLGDSIEVLSGASAGERVATDPQAAARVQ